MTDLRPNLFLVGAAKAGTTSLYHFLRDHPDVFMSPVKEPHYFSTDIEPGSFRPNYRKAVQRNYEAWKSGLTETCHMAFIRDEAVYHELFKDAAAQAYCGEASASYLFSKVAADRIHAFNPEARIVMVLRDPIDRAYSHYQMDFRDGRVLGSFIEEFRADLAKTEKGWGQSHLYYELGCYASQVKRYLDRFPREQLMILRYEDMLVSPDDLGNRLTSFLGLLEGSGMPSANRAQRPRWPMLSQWIRRQRFVKRVPPRLRKAGRGLLFSNRVAAMRAEDRVEAAGLYSVEIAALQKLLPEIDFSGWASS